MTNIATVFIEVNYLNAFLDKVKKESFFSFIENKSSEYVKLYDLIFERSKLSIDLSAE